MSEAPALTDVEWRLMQCLWAHNQPMTVREISQAVEADTGWSKHSIISFLKRMAAKGYVEIDHGRPIRYRPLLDRQDTMRKETQNLLGKVYGGDLMLMVSNAVRVQPLSEDEINELISILKEKER